MDIEKPLSTYNCIVRDVQQFMGILMLPDLVGALRTAVLLWKSKDNLVQTEWYKSHEGIIGRMYFL